MNRRFLKQLWRKACHKMNSEFARYEGIGLPTEYPEMELPYLDESQEVTGFISEMDLTSVANMTKPLTEEDAAWLLSRYPKDVILETLCAMENYKGLNRKYKSAKLTCNQWAKKRMSDARESSGSSTNIPVT